MVLGKYAYVEQIRCTLKRDSKIPQRNNWCEKDGDCESCGIASYYVTIDSSFPVAPILSGVLGDS